MAQDDKVWWYAKGDQKFGPFSAPQLKEIAGKGTIELTDLIWKEGLPNWIVASSVKGLIPVKVPAAPPPLPVTTKPSTPVSDKAKPVNNLPNQKASIATAQTNLKTTHIESESLLTNPAFWNPSALANWSILLTPLFGSYLVTENYTAMGNEEAAKGAKVWLFIGAAIMVSAFTSLLLGFTKFFMVVLLAYFAYLISWYFLSARKQHRGILAEYGNDYERQPWLRVLAIGGAGMVAWQLLLRMV